MSLNEKMQEAFNDVPKLSFLKDKREQEVFKLALSTAHALVKQFIKDDWKLIELFFKGDIDFHELIKRRNVLVGKGLI